MVIMCLGPVNVYQMSLVQMVDVKETVDCFGRCFAKTWEFGQSMSWP